MSGSRFGFTAVRPQPWKGRYRRVPGETTALHVRGVDGKWWPVVDWVREDETGECVMVDEGDVEELVGAVNAGKSAQGGSAGGAFLVDEYGRVLVPSSNGGSATVFVVGECGGPMRFEDPFAPGSTFELYGDDGLAIGDPWERPYLGLQYQLSKHDELYFWHEDELGGGKVTPPVQDEALVANLRRIRPYGPVRFLIGPGGVALTRVPPLWTPVYAGRVNLQTWFAKEELE